MNLRNLFRSATALIALAGLLVFASTPVLAADAGHDAHAATPAHGSPTADHGHADTHGHGDSHAASPTLLQSLGYSYLTAFLFCLSFALGGIIFLIIHHLFDAGWSVPVIRLAEHLACLIRH
ncbi:MAG: hypothetical protein ACKPGI_16920 [Verrucomicrobiota bacterium]